MERFNCSVVKQETEEITDQSVDPIGVSKCWDNMSMVDPNKTYHREDFEIKKEFPSITLPSLADSGVADMLTNQEANNQLHTSSDDCVPKSDTCDVVAKMESNPTVHMGSQCHFCDFSTESPVYLRIHIDSVHFNLRPHKCDTCDYATSKKSDLTLHIESVHLKVRRNKCKICSFTCSSKSSLRRHIDNVHLKLKKLQCQLCDYSTNLTVSLRKHIDSVHLRLKPFHCDTCDYACTKKSSLKTHIDCFHSIRYKCDTCNYATVSESDLEIHRNAIHPQLNADNFDSGRPWRIE